MRVFKALRGGAPSAIIVRLPLSAHRSVPKGGRTRSEGDRRLTLDPRSSALNELFLNDRRRDQTAVDFAASSRWDCLAGFPAPQKEFPVRNKKFPVPRHRELVANSSGIRRNFGLRHTGEGQFPRNSLYFPCGSGNPAERRVRERLHPPPSSPRLRRPCARTASDPENRRGFAEFWASGPVSPKSRRARGNLPGAGSRVVLRRRAGHFGLLSRSGGSRDSRLTARRERLANRKR